MFFNGVEVLEISSKVPFHFSIRNEELQLYRQKVKDDIKPEYNKYSAVNCRSEVYAIKKEINKLNKGSNKRIN
ncbi:hypothetical protein BCR21_13415 [Enterococcus ureasiticus]|uniref:Uncharacterized protein n=1 Tax=Enterococcus ureasiticus TaxID=903984 RepID=A0A1E5GCB2_9ENTE|nr:hypothetical protein BCR21_13415 [Enterococcus ureasiticus]